MQREFHQELSRDELQALKNKRAGLFLFQLSWIMVFVCLIIVNWQLRFSYPSWPPPGVEKLGLGLPSVAAALLLVSGYLARRANHANQSNREAAFVAAWRGALLLGGMFVLIMAFEWITAPMGTQYGSVFRLMTGFHAVHALVIGGYMAFVYRSRAAHEGDVWPVESAAKLWYFVVIAWMMFYLVLYWI